MTVWGVAGRILSLVLGIVYGISIVSAMKGYYPVPAQAALRSVEWCALVVVPILLIWFPEFIGAATGYIGNGNETPPGLIAALGWIFLIGIPLVLYLVNG